MKAISLFSGAGGDTLGMEKAGVNVCGFVENNEKCIQTHLKNFPNSQLIGRDICLIQDEEFEKYSFVDLIFAGFPCQGFSNAGKKKINDPRNSLFKEFVRVVKIIKPKFFIGENVKGLLSRKTDENLLYIDVIVKEFTQLGYNVKYKVVNSMNFSVPQKRERLIIIGCNTKEVFFAEIKSNICSVKDIIEYSLHNAIKIDFSLINFNDNCFVLTEKLPITGNPHPYMIKKINENLLSFGKRISPHHCEIVDLNQPCKTITCSYTFQPRLYVLLRFEMNELFIRTFTIKELQQIQGFPYDFEFVGNENEQIKQIGNAVPPNVVKCIVKHLI